jgi:hypothetical protein
MNDKHTITIEQLNIYPGGHETTAVVERFNGGFVKICATADRLAEGQSLIDEARGWARTYGAEFDAAAAVAEAVLQS